VDIVYLCIKNWEKFQEKRTNAKGEVWRPPWVKLYVDSSRDYDYSRLSMRQRGLLMEMWKLAGRLENQIPHDPEWIARAIQTNEDLSDDLIELLKSGFVQGNPNLSDVITETFQQDVGSKEGKAKEISPNGDTADSIRLVFDHWKVARNKKRARLTDGRRRKVKARLGSFTEDELMRAIDALALDPWPDRKRYDELSEHVFRNDEQVEKWLELADAPPEKRTFTAEDIRSLV
jgi:hypothetical protein